VTNSRVSFSCPVRLIDLLNGGSARSGASRLVTASGSTGESTWHTAWHTAGGATSTLVHLGDDWGADLLEFLLLVFELVLLGSLVGIEPLDGLAALVGDGLDLFLGDLVLDLVVLDGLLHLESVGLELVLGLDLVLLGLVFRLELLGVVDHLFNVLLGKSALVVGDGDLVLFASGLVTGRDVEDTVSIDVEGDLDLGNTSWSWGDLGEIELAEDVVVLGHGSFTFEDLDEDTGLVVGVGGEGLGLLGGDGGVSLDQGGHDATSGLDTERERGDIEEKEILDFLGFVAAKDGGLDGGTVGNGLIGVDGLVEFLAVEVVLEELLDLGDSSGATNEDDIVDAVLVDSGVSERFLDGVEGSSEEVGAKLFKSSSGDGGVEVNTLEERIDFDSSLGGGREGSLRSLAGGSETSDSALRSGDVLLVLSLELLGEVVDKSVIEIFTTQVSVTSGGFDLEDTVFDGENGDIKGSATKIEDEDVSLGADLLVKTVSDGSSGRLVDDTEDVETGNGTGVLGGLSLRVVEVSGDSDDSVGDILSKVSLGGVSHLGEDHGGDLFGEEGLGLALVFDLDLGLGVVVDDVEGPVLHVGLDNRVVELSADQSLGVKDRV